MNEKVKQAVEKLRELDLYDLHSEDFDNILGALDNMEELIKGKDEYIAKLCNDRAELKEEIKRLDSQYKNIHNTKVKVPLCDIFNGLSQKERHRVIEDIYYSQAERQDFYENKISKLETELKELKDLQDFAKIVITKETDMPILLTLLRHNKLTLENYRKGTRLGDMDSLQAYADFDLVKRVVEKYGKN